jgi:hypothetical protein
VSEKVAHGSARSAAGTVPGSTLELPAGKVTEPPKRSLPVNSLSATAPAALKVLCPDEYSGKGGVREVVGWYGDEVAPSICCTPSYGPAQGRTVCPRNK